MDEKKQKLLIEYLISSPNTFAVCQGIVRPEYFDPQFRNSVKFVKEYYNKYNTTPSPEQIAAETDQSFTQKEIKPDQVSYCTTEIETFCRRKALEKAVLASPELIEKGDYGTLEAKIREAILVSLDKDLGVNYFETTRDRLERMMQEDPVESIGWKSVDDLLFGGIARKELLLFSANSGGGKSIVLTNVACNFLERKRDVLYISLELAEDIVSQRVDTMLTGIGRKIWKEHVNEIVTKIDTIKGEMGMLTVKYMPTDTKASEIRAYLKEYYLFHNKMPDLLIVDYLDKMAPNESVDADNVFLRDKRVSEQLRQIGVDYNMFVATASQLNREAVKAVAHDHSHIAGGISKINEADVYISIKLTEPMRVKGEIMFSFQKTRNSDGVGKHVFLKWDAERLRIRDINTSTDNKLMIRKKDSVQSIAAKLGDPSEGKSSLADLLTYDK